MDGKTWIMTFLLTGTCITGIEAVTILYRNGCIRNTNPGITNIMLRTQLPNNYPGTCYSYCRTQNATSSNGSYLALQGETCMCGKHYQNSYFDKIGCNEPCPGHHDHFCGQKNMTYSLYIIASDNKVKTEKMCVARNCKNQQSSQEGVNCSAEHYTHCIEEFIIPGTSISCGQTNVTWNMSSTDCSYSPDRMRFYSTCTQICSACNHYKTGLYWLGIFAVWAPPKTQCSYLVSIEHGSWSFTKDNETVEYHCSAGFSLKGSKTRYCMHNSSWSGNQPHCVASTTTTSSTVTTTTASTTTTTSTLTPTVATSTSSIITTLTPTPTVTASTLSTSTTATPTPNVTTTNPPTSSTSTNKSTTATLPTSTTAGQSKYRIATIVLGILSSVLLIAFIIYIIKYNRKATNRISPSTTDDIESADKSKVDALSKEREASNSLPKANHESFAPSVAANNQLPPPQTQDTEENSRPTLSTNTQVAVEENGDNVMNIKKRHKKKKKHKKKRRHRTETDDQLSAKEQEAWNGDDTTAKSSKAQLDVTQSDTVETLYDRRRIAP